MAKIRRSPWTVDYDRNLTKHAFFLSFVREDADSIIQLKAEIAAISGRGGRRSLDSFVDRHNWPAVLDLGHALRVSLMGCHFMVAWITPSYLANHRGWVWLEFAYGELIELSLNPSGHERDRPFIVPVFRNLTVDQVERTPLLNYWQRSLTPPGQELPMTEIARRLVDFYDQQARLQIQP